MGKRNTTDFGRAVLALKLKPLYVQQAHNRKMAGKADANLNTDDGNGYLPPNWAGGQGDSRDAVAKVAGVGHNTLRRVEQILEKATPEVIAKVRAGEMSIHAAAKTVAAPKPPKPPKPATPGPTTQATDPAANEDPDPAPSDQAVPAGMMLMNDDLIAYSGKFDYPRW